MPKGIYNRKLGSQRPYPKGEVITLTESPLNGPVKTVKPANVPQEANG